MVCLRNICINTPRKGVDDDDDDNSSSGLGLEKCDYVTITTTAAAADRY
jgi:hypothetical protein